MNKAMSSIQDLYEAIAAEGFSERVLHLIEEQVNDIQNGTEDFSRFNLSEHAGLCKGGKPSKLGNRRTSGKVNRAMG